MSPEYEDYIYDQLDKETYSDYWKQIGLNCEEYIEQFADIPCLFLSGWYDIYCKSTIEFYLALSNTKKSPIRLIMGPWQHVGTEGHVAGEVDFGVNALITGNLAPSVFSLSRRWFDRFTEPAQSSNKSEAKLQSAINQAQLQSINTTAPIGSHEPNITSLHAHTSSAYNQPSSISSTTQLQPQPHPNTMPRGPYTSLSRLGTWQPPTVDAKSGPHLYVLPNALPRDRIDTLDTPLPPNVRYFRMGGGDGHKTTQNCIFHGGVWMQSYTWPPNGTEYQNYYLSQRTLNNHKSDPRHSIDNTAEQLGNINIDSHLSNNTNSSAIPDGTDDIDAWQPIESTIGLRHDASQCTTFIYDPSSPQPSIGGHVFQHKNILLGGSYDQVERSDMFLCKPPYLPLSSRRDVTVYRSDVLTDRIDITGQPYVILYISSDCVDTDFYCKLIDEYPPSNDYPLGFSMLITHGIQRCKMRLMNGRGNTPSLLKPNYIYKLRIDMYPTSNLFNKSHRIRLDISSSNFPHYDINQNTGQSMDSQDYYIARNTVYHNTIYQSRLVLPVQTMSQNTNSIHMEEATHH